MIKKFLVTTGCLSVLAACGAAPQGTVNEGREVDGRNAHLADAMQRDLIAATNGLRESTSETHKVRYDASDRAKAHAAEAKDKAGESVDAAQQSARESAEAARQATREAADKTVEAANHAANATVEAAHNAKDKTAEAARDIDQAARDRAKTVSDTVKQTAHDSAETVKTHVQSAWDTTKATGGHAWQATKDTAQASADTANAGAQAVKARAHETAGVARGMFERAGNAVSNTGRGIVDATRRGLGDLHEASQGAWRHTDQRVESAKATAARAAEKIAGSARKGAERVEQGAQQSRQQAEVKRHHATVDVQKAQQSPLESASDAVDETGDAAKDVGSSAQDMGKDAKDTAGDVGSSAKDKAKDAKDSVGDFFGKGKSRIVIPQGFKPSGDEVHILPVDPQSETIRFQDATGVLANSVCKRYIEDNDVGPGFEYADEAHCIADHQSRFASFYDIDNCHGVGFDASRLEACAEMAASEEVSYQPLTNRAFLATCCPQICATSAR